MKVVVPFTRDEANRLHGVVTTLLPSTTYEFSVYAVNPFNFNSPPPTRRP